MIDAVENGEVVGDPGDEEGEHALEAGEINEVNEVNEALSLASAALSAMGFLTLLRLADRRDRSPAKALGLFLATSLESTAGTVLGVVAIGRNREADRISRGFLIGAAGTVLGMITTILTFDWMRTKRRR